MQMEHGCRTCSMWSTVRSRCAVEEIHCVGCHGLNIFGQCGKSQQTKGVKNSRKPGEERTSHAIWGFSTDFHPAPIKTPPRPFSLIFRTWVSLLSGVTPNTTLPMQNIYPRCMDMKRRKFEKAEEGIRKGPEKDAKKAEEGREGTNSPEIRTCQLADAMLRAECICRTKSVYETVEGCQVQAKGRRSCTCIRC
jgi:hypothetical protein